MPIDKVFALTDKNAYLFSLHIDANFAPLKTKFHDIHKLIDVDDFLKLLMNCKYLQESEKKCLDELSLASKLSKDGKSACYKTISDLTTILQKKYCGSYNFPIYFIEKSLFLFQEIAPIILLTMEIDNKIAKSEKINFSYLIYKIKNSKQLLNEILNDDKISPENKNIILSYLNTKSIEKIYDLFFTKYSKYCEQIIYSKLFDSTEKIGTLLQVKTEIGFAKCVKLSIVLDELIQAFSDDAKSIFKKESIIIVGELLEQKRYLAKRFKLLDHNIVELHKLDKLAHNTSNDIEKLHTEAEIIEYKNKVIKEFPAFGKAEFVKMIDERLIHLLTIRKDDNLISKIKFNKHVENKKKES